MSSTLFERLTPELIARHILRFLPFNEAFQLKSIFPKSLQTPLWCVHVQVDAENWKLPDVRRSIFSVLPYTKKLTITGYMDLFHQWIEEFRQYDQHTLFRSLEELSDTGNFLDFLLCCWPSIRLSRLRCLSFMFSGYSTPRLIGPLISKDIMPHLKYLDISWGYPLFTNIEGPVILHSLHMPRGWSLNDAAEHLCTLPKGSAIQELHITHAMSDTLIRDLMVLQRVLSNSAIQIYLYHMTIHLSFRDLANDQVWNFLSRQNHRLHFDACAITMDEDLREAFSRNWEVDDDDLNDSLIVDQTEQADSALTIRESQLDLNLPSLQHSLSVSYLNLEPIVFPPLKRFELRNFRPSINDPVFFKFQFTTVPQLVFIRGCYSNKHHKMMAALFSKHPSFKENQFKIAFDVYDPILKKNIQDAWSKLCPQACMI